MSSEPHLRPTRRWKARRRQILDVAERVFAERGREGARMEDIAAEIGVRRPSLVYYFPDKDALYNAVMEDICSGILDLLPAESGPEALAALADRWVDFLSRRPDAARLLLREALSGTLSSQPRVVELLRTITRSYGGIRSSGARPGSGPDALHRALAIAGVSLFLTGAAAVIRKIWNWDPLSPANLRRQKETLRALSSPVRDRSRRSASARRGS